MVCLQLFVFALIVAGVASRSSKDLIQADDVAGNPHKEDIGEEKVAEGLDEIVKDLQLVEKLDSELAGDETTRESRTLLRKLSFLAGLKAGGIIQSSGTIAASNSLNILGKVWNAALSVSYGPLNETGALPTIYDGPAKAEETADDDNTRIGQGENAAPSRTVLQTIKSNFLRSHNALVERVNNKFLRNIPSGKSI